MSDRDTDITQIRVLYNAAFTYNEQAGVHENDATAHWNLAQDHAAIEDLLFCVIDLKAAITRLTYKYAPWHPDLPIPHFLEYHTTESAAFDMESIINAMLTADPDQTLYFVGLVDAYRQSVWTRPYNKEFFAALARGFMEWE